MSQLYSRCLVFPASFCLFISFSLQCFDAFSLFAHVHSAVSLCTSFFLPVLLSYCLACRYTLTRSLHLYQLKKCSCSQADWVVLWWSDEEGGRERLKRFIWSNFRREIIADVQNVFLLCPIFLCLHVFLFIIFYFLYRPCDQSLMNLPASFSGRSPMCRTYIYSTVCTCVFLEMFGISDKESGSYFLV